MGSCVGCAGHDTPLLLPTRRYLV
uniref:Uncharacterized protein n=1 Tax=Anguilla anguilla TaxID=7936 RepID=A0A0E9UZ18_ANGAN